MFDHQNNSVNIDYKLLYKFSLQMKNIELGVAQIGQ